ncbi:hypothetical protein [Shewanella sp. YLB-07]|uniref:hypothetical protein n=1 Tax=Shewanella sp. YLB-07 TaxID=2601268 RepID=UPI00128CC707|nr:hypothetical protein [Shewanella sp. YLB-07]MPY23959.1 hypothetical protein [Shewanella sp. YLB-07]
MPRDKGWDTSFQSVPQPIGLVTKDGERKVIKAPGSASTSRMSDAEYEQGKKEMQHEAFVNRKRGEVTVPEDPEYYRSQNVMDSQAAQSADKPKVVNKKWSEFQRDWQNYVEGKNVDVRVIPPEASVRFSYRYVTSNNTGGLKYDPAIVDKLLANEYNSDKLEDVYYGRQVHDSNTSTIADRTRSKQPEALTKCIMKISPNKQAGTPLIVASVGMPKEFKNDRGLEKLYWYNQSDSRPVYLFVHKSEVNLYEVTMGEILRKKGIGLVSWEYPSGQVGFGATRKAAVDYSADKGFNKVIMMDHNVADSQYDLISMAEDATSEIGDGSALYIGLGASSSTLSARPVKAHLTKKIIGRPIEQLTMLNDKVQFDPAFIASSEDMDLTKDMLFFNSLNQEELISSSYLKLQDKNTGAYPKILKVPLSATSRDYIQLVDDLLKKLSEEEKDIVIQVKSGVNASEKNYVGEEVSQKEHFVTIGTLADFISDRLGKDKSRIQSIIVEKMLLQYKHANTRSAYKLTTPEPMDTVSVFNDMETDRLIKKMKRK